MTRFYSELTKGISQKRREQIEKRKEEIRCKVVGQRCANTLPRDRQLED
jgi:hypothetical protein